VKCLKAFQKKIINREICFVFQIFTDRQELHFRIQLVDVWQRQTVLTGYPQRFEYSLPETGTNKQPPYEFLNKTRQTFAIYVNKINPYFSHLIYIGLHTHTQYTSI